MSKPNAVILEAKGLNTQPNELHVPEGSLVVAENVEITRDNIVQVSPGFQTLGASTNMPAFEPQQLFSYGGVLYAHLDNGIWYFDSSSSKWLRKRGNFGSRSATPFGCVYVSGHLYFLSSSCVWDLNASTGALSVLAGRYASTGSTDGTGSAARFNTPHDICSDGTNLFVSDTSNHTIRKIVISTAVVTTLAGTAGASGSTDATGASARFNTPVGICTDNTNLYVCEQGNGTIRKIVISSAVVTTLAGTAGAFGGTDATGAAARFENPQDICHDSGNLYVSDYGGPTIRKVVASSGVVTTLAGTHGSTGSANGTGSAASFDGPMGICSDATNLYVCDSNNKTIRKIVISSAVVTTPYGAAAQQGFVDGNTSTARFNTPQDIAFDGSDLYVSDYANNAIRKIYLTPSYVTTVSGFGGALSFGSLSAAPQPYADGIVVGPD